MDLEQRERLPIKAVLFDWGDTLMRDFPDLPGPMVSWPYIEVLEGTPPALEALQGRYILGVASNAGASDAAKMGLALERGGIRAPFDFLATSKELGAAKPDPAFFRAACAGMGQPPGACIMVGNDYRKDIEGAHAAGLRTIWLNPGGGPAPGPAADLVITTPAELPAAIRLLDATP